MIELNYQNALNKNNKSFIPTKQQLTKWLAIISTQLKEQKSVEVTVRIVEKTEITQLNTDYRNKQSATNVLSFPFEEIEGSYDGYLGDIIICAEVITNEAKQQHKNLEHHWQHMLIHGCLHLYGYDHIDDLQAQQMESLEILILKKMGISSPYE